MPFVKTTTKSDDTVVMETSAEVDPGTRLFSSKPLVSVSFIPGSKLGSGNDADAKIGGATPSMSDLYDVPNAILKDMPKSVEWTLVYLLIVVKAEGRRDKLAAMLKEFQRPGTNSAGNLLFRMFKAKRELPATDRQWIGKFLRDVRDLNIENLLDVYNVVAKYCLVWKTALTDISYGAGVYSVLMNIEHSCAPSARLLFDMKSLGVVHGYALTKLRSGTAVMVNRFFASDPIIRCVATGPEWLMRSVLSQIGKKCDCSECEAAMSGPSVRPTKMWPDTFPLNMYHQPNGLDWLLAKLNKNGIAALLKRETPVTLVKIAAARTIVANAIGNQRVVVKKVGGELIDLATEVDFWGGLKLTEEALKQQGACEALIDDRCSDHAMRAAFSRVIAMSKYRVDAAVLANAGSEGAQNGLAIVRKAVDATIILQMRNALMMVSEGLFGEKGASAENMVNDCFTLTIMNESSMSLVAGTIVQFAMDPDGGASSAVKK